MPTQEENSYMAKLERAMLDETLKGEADEDEDSPQMGRAANVLKNRAAEAIGTALGGKSGGEAAKKAASELKSFAQVARAVAAGQYVVWQAIWDLLVPSFGLSLFLVFVPIFSWISKNTFPQSISSALPEPGMDGMVGIVPPPDPKTAKFVLPLYGMVNKITMLGLAFILILVLMIGLLMIIIPPFLMYRTASAIFGPLGEMLSRIFGGV